MHAQVVRRRLPAVRAARRRLIISRDDEDSPLDGSTNYSGNSGTTVVESSGGGDHNSNGNTEDGNSGNRDGNGGGQQVTITRIVQTTVGPQPTSSSLPDSGNNNPQQQSVTQTGSVKASGIATATNSAASSAPALPPAASSAASSASLSSSTVTTSTSPGITNTPVSTTSTSSTIVTSSSAGGGTSADANAGTSGAAAKSRGVPGAVIGVVVGLISLGILALAFFLLRKRFIARRQRKRATWGASIFPSTSEKPRIMLKTADSSRDLPYSNITPEDMRGPSPLPNPYGPPEGQGDPGYGQAEYNRAEFGAAALTTPPTSYNNPRVPPPAPVPSPGFAGPQPQAPLQDDTAMVRCAFIPSLPDELSIALGERVRVLNEFDDGWAQCVNANGEQGMVPLECLQRGRDAPGADVATGDWRQLKRNASLRSQGGAGGARY